MAGVYRLEIAESVEELKKLMHAQKSPSDKERVQLLYLLKSGQAQTVQEASSLLGRNRVTLQRWLGFYREGGLAGLLRHKARTGRQASLPQWVQDALEQRLHQPEGFNSYSEICQWLEEELDFFCPYKTVYNWVHYRFKASPKVARPVIPNP